MDQRNIIIA